MPWQPFDTAPKLPRVDNKGPRILARTSRGEVVIYWQHIADSHAGGWWVDPSIVPSVVKNPTEWRAIGGEGKADKKDENVDKKLATT